MDFGQRLRCELTGLRIEIFEIAKKCDKLQNLVNRADQLVAMRMEESEQTGVFDVQSERK